MLEAVELQAKQSNQVKTYAIIIIIMFTLRRACQLFRGQQVKNSSRLQLMQHRSGAHHCPISHLPAGVSDLNTGLADMDGKNFTPVVCIMMKRSASSAVLGTTSGGVVDAHAIDTDSLRRNLHCKIA